MEKEHISREFTIQETNIAKGVACMLLLFHHLFYNESKFELFWHLTNPPLISTAATLGKVCVAMFLLLSGYGMVKSAEFDGKVGVKFTLRHLTKLMMQFWFIYILFVPLGFVFGRSPLDIYGIGIKGIIKAVIDFLGISNIMNTPTMNATWWFMGCIIVLYIGFPILYRAMKNKPYITLVISLLICLFSNGNSRWFHAILVWIFPFVSGMFLAEKDLINKFFQRKPLIQVLSVIVFFIVSLVIRKIVGIRADTFFGLSIMGVWFAFFGNLKRMSSAIGFIGKHSGNIFMFHTFIYAYYFKEIIYSLWYPPLIYVNLLLICVVVSVLIEKLKLLIRFDKFQRLAINELK